MRKIRIGTVSLAVIFALSAAARVDAGSAAEDFYRGKVIRIVVGFSPGGGFDTFARTVARHMGKHVPGNPNFVVENMTGAGSLIAASHVYNVAKPDGLTIGAFNGNQILAQLVGRQGITFDARKMEWLGAPGYNHDLCLLSRKTGVTSADQWLASKGEFKLAGSAPGATTDDVAKILKEAIGLPVRLISGYKGTANMRVAVESGEVDGLCGFSWASVRTTWRKALDNKLVTIMLQSAPKAHRELPNVPLSISYAKTAEARQLVESGIHQPSAITYSYSIPPGTPKERVQTLRQAFTRTVKDADFLSEAAKANLEIAPASGEQIEEAIRKLFNTPPAIVAKLKEVLK